MSCSRLRLLIQISMNDDTFLAVYLLVLISFGIVERRGNTEEKLETIASDGEEKQETSSE